MKIEKTWSASTPGEINGGDELVNLVGRWNIGIEVSVNNPYIFSKGPIEKRTFREEIHYWEILPSPTTA